MFDKIREIVSSGSDELKRKISKTVETTADAETDTPFTVKALTPEDLQRKEFIGYMSGQHFEDRPAKCDGDEYIWIKADEYMQGFLSSRGYTLIKSEIFEDCIGYHCYRKEKFCVVYMFAYGKEKKVMLDGEYCDKFLYKPFNNIVDSLHRQILLEIFRRVCNFLQESNNNIMFKNLLRSKTTSSGTMLAYIDLISKVTPLSLSENDVKQIIEWIKAFWEKSDERKPIPDSFRQRLLKKQGNRCACCGKNITNSNHVDHIIPFKYTGDELPEENYRCLCEKCNLNKSAILSTIITDICNGMYQK